MGGISVLVLFGIMSSLLYLFFTMFLVIIIYIVITYVFESIALKRMMSNLQYKNSFTAWIPFYNKFLLGKIAGNKKLGIILAIVDLITACSGIYCYNQNTYIVQGFIVFLICILISFILNTILSDKIYKKAINKYSDILTIFSVLSLGSLRPIFLFLVRNREM